MDRVLGIRLGKSGPIYYANAEGWELPRDTHVVVQSNKGPELGWVAWEARPVVHLQPEDTVSLSMVRRATAADFAQREQVQEREREALKLARAQARELGVAMKIVDTHYSLDGLRLTVTFGAEGRVDFRSLLRSLSSRLRCRIDLRQVGERDVARLTGGLGRCGRSLCCATWMSRFVNISVRMAKEQALPISAEGLAGACGRLRCCLRFEYEQYRQVNRALPRIGEEVETPRGRANVVVGHRIKETVSVRYADDRILEWPLAEVRRLPTSAN